MSQRVRQVLGRLCLRKSLQPRRQVEASKGQKPWRWASWATKAPELNLFRDHWEVELSSWFEDLASVYQDEEFDV